MYVCKYVMYNVLQKKAFNADLLSIKHVVFMVGDKVTTFFGLFVCFNLGFALLQTDSSAPALPPEGGFGTPQ